MCKLSNNQAGFSAVEGILVLVIIAILGFTGWFVWHAKQASDKNLTANSSTTPTFKKQNKTSTASKSPVPTTNILSLVNKTVTMTMPSSWTYVSSASDCYNTVTSSGVNCKDGAIITPGVKLPTIYGSGTEFFNIQVGVYSNPSNHSPKDWIEKDLNEGVPNPQDQDVTSDASINGYDTYFWNVVNSNYHELRYVFSAQNDIVFVYARTYEPGSSNGKPAGDFRQFETQITQMAKTVKIQS